MQLPTAVKQLNEFYSSHRPFLEGRVHEAKVKRYRSMLRLTGMVQELKQVECLATIIGT